MVSVGPNKRIGDAVARILPVASPTHFSEEAKTLTFPYSSRLPERIEPDPKEPTVTLLKMSDGKRLVIMGDYDAVSSQIASAHHQALKP
jgi:hypothetical protein